MNTRITVDARQVKELGEQFGEAAEVGLRRTLERGEQLVREEAPEQTRNLKQGVTSDVLGWRAGMLTGEIVATARTGRRGRRAATLHLPSGKTKKVTLRAVPEFNYAGAVALGTGVFSPNKAAITPRKAKALLVPVASAPTLNGKPVAYITADGQMYVMRRSMKGAKPNPYHERAGRRLDAEARPIFDRALRDFVGGEP